MSAPAAVRELGGSRAASGFIFATALMNVMAFGIVLPVLPNLIKDFAGGDTSRATEWSTLFAALWGLMQFVCGPALGALSDRIGRRPVLLISLFGLAADLFIMALAPNLAWLLVGRLVNGVTSASLSTANAYIADVTPPEQRARAFGQIGGAVSLGFLVGPALGGLLAGIDLRLPFYVAGGLTALNWLYGFVILPESLAPHARTPRIDPRKLNPFSGFTFLRAHPGLLGLSLLGFVYQLAWMVGPAVFVLYGGHRYGWTPTAIGLVMLLSGGLGTLVQIALVGPVVSRFGERGAVLIGAGMGAVGYACFGLADTGIGYLCAIPVLVFFNLFIPGLQGLMTRRVSQAEQGQLQGALQGLLGLASIFGPIVFGLSFAWAVRPEATQPMPGLPFFIASALLVVALGLAFRIAKAGESAHREGGA